MGALAERAGIAAALFKSAERALGRFRGGLAMAVIGACMAFGAICGSSVATTATFGRAALPELQQYSYDGGFSTGTIAVGGTLGILIPPSVILVVYAITTEQNIAKLFQAALIPGLLAAAFYCLTIAVVVRRNPALRPTRQSRASSARRNPVAEGRLVAWRLRPSPRSLFAGALARDNAAMFAALALLVMFVDVAVMPAIMIAIVVVGGIYGGVFTPTEGAAVGAIAMLLVGLAQRTLGWKEILQAIRQTAETVRHDLHHPAGRRGFRRLHGAVAVADIGGGGHRRLRLLALCGADRDAGVLHPARRRDGRARHDPADAAGVLSRSSRHSISACCRTRSRSGSAFWC